MDRDWVLEGKRADGLCGDLFARHARTTPQGLAAAGARARRCVAERVSARHVDSAGAARAAERDRGASEYSAGASACAGELVKVAVDADAEEPLARRVVAFQLRVTRAIAGLKKVLWRRFRCRSFSLRWVLGLCLFFGLALVYNVSCYVPAETS
jgi:hypothetical protein